MPSLLFSSFATHLFKGDTLTHFIHVPRRVSFKKKKASSKKKATRGRSSSRNRRRRPSIKKTVRRAAKPAVRRAARAVEQEVEKEAVSEEKRGKSSLNPLAAVFNPVTELASNVSESVLKPVASIMNGLGGVGDYTYDEIPTDVKNNTLMGVNTPEVAAVPQMHSKHGAFRFTHREYITDVSMSTAFSRLSYDLDPTRAGTFPWLSTLIGSFQEWKLLGCVVEFVSTSANAISGTVAGMGSISLSCRYDVYQPPPVNKMQALNSADAMSGKPSENLIFGVECDPDETPTQPLYVRSLFGSNTPDLHYYQFGTIDLITSGAPNPYAGAGQLWITYDILAIKPRVGTSPTFYSHAQLSDGPGFFTTPSAAVTSVNTFDTNYLNLKISTDGNTLMFDPTSFANVVFFVYTTYNTAAITPGTGEPPTLTLSGGLSLFNAFQGSSLPAVGTNEGDVSDYWFAFAVQYDGSGTPAAPPSVTFSAYEIETGLNLGDLYVFAVYVAPPVPLY